MRTIAAKHQKGQEPRRTILDTLRLIRYIASAGFIYFVAGRRIRKVWYMAMGMLGLFPAGGTALSLSPAALVVAPS